MSTEVKKQESGTEVSTAMDLGSWGNNQMSAKDLVIPKILPQQPASQYVMEEKATFGDFCHSLTGEILGSCDKPMSIIPIYMDKIWIVSKKVDGDFAFDRIEPVTDINENLPWSDVEGGVELKREYVRNFYVLLDGYDMPFVISFKGMSSKAGQVLATQAYTLNAMAKLPPAGMVIELSGKKDKNDKGRFMVLDVKPKERATNEQVGKAFEWLQAIEAGIAKVDDSDIKSGKQTEMFDKGSKF